MRETQVNLGDPGDHLKRKLKNWKHVGAVFYAEWEKAGSEDDPQKTLISLLFIQTSIFYV